jgi:hypothetical protein
MKLLARLMFVSMIAVGLLAQAARIKRSGGQPATATAVIDAGTRLGLTPANGTRAFPLDFTANACGEQIHIDASYLDGRHGDEALDASGSPRIIRYVFLGSVRERQDLTAFRTRWLFANVLFVSGLRSGRPGAEILSVMIPERCPGLVDLDWAQLSPW